MTLEPLMPTLEADDNSELLDFTRRFWWSLPLTIVVTALAMLGHGAGWLSPQTQSWVELVRIRARNLSRATIANMKQNLAFAFLYNSLGIPSAAGVLYPWTGWLLSSMSAALAMSLSSASVIFNALRLRSSAA